MAFDKRKALQTALGYTQQGRWDKAINEYQAILRADPADLSVYNMLGDLYARIGSKEEATSYYLKLGELYRADGLSVKAIAVYKKIIKLDPTNVFSYLACGDLYAEQGLIAEARIQYLTAADFYGKEGLAQKALGVYQKLADLDPANLTIRAKLGEMLVKEGLKKEAGDEFMKVASGCIQIGQLREADKFLKRAIQIQPDSIEARSLLAQLYYRLEDFPSAIEQMNALLEMGKTDSGLVLALVDSYTKSRQLEKADELLSRIIKEKPHQIDINSSLGKLKLAMGKTEEGYYLLGEVASEHIKRNETASALELLNAVKKADPGFIKVRERLVDIYHQIGDGAEARKEYREIGEIFAGQKNWEEAAKAYKYVVQEEPANEEVRIRLAEIEAFLSPSPQVLPAPETEPSPEHEPSESVMELAQVDLEKEPEPLVTPAIQEIGSVEEVVPLPIQGKKEPVGKITEDASDKVVKEHLVEAEIYLKYGIIEKAMEHLKNVLDIAPHHIEAHQKLKGIYIDKGEGDLAVEEGLILADILEEWGRIDEAKAEIEGVLALDPNHAEAEIRLQKISAQTSLSLGESVLSSFLEQIPIAHEVTEESIPFESSLEMVAASGFAGEMDLGERVKEAGIVEDEERPIQEEELPAEIEALLEERGEEEKVSVVQEGDQGSGIEEDLAEADFYLQHEMAEEAKGIYQRILEVDPHHEFARERLSQIAMKEVSGEDMAMPQISALRESEEGEQLDRFEWEILQPLSGESIDAASEGEAIVTIPEEEAPPKEMEQASSGSTTPPEIPLTKDVTPVFRVAPLTLKPLGESFVDFGAELEMELEKEAEDQKRSLEELARSEVTPPTLNEILQEFQKGVRQSLEEKDFETHYNLGIAYKDMDLLEEAIEEFKLASKEPGLTLDCSQLIGLCYMKMGSVNAAIEEFLKGLSIPDRSVEQYRGLKYELALAYEASGNLDNALDLFSGILEEDPNFRDVEVKVETLRAPQYKPSPGEDKAAKGEKEPESPKRKSKDEKASAQKPHRRVHYI